jgi:hypothetical protein
MCSLFSLTEALNVTRHWNLVGNSRVVCISVFPSLKLKASKLQEFYRKWTFFCDLIVSSFFAVPDKIPVFDEALACWSISFNRSGFSTLRSIIEVSTLFTNWHGGYILSCITIVIQIANLLAF